MANKEYDGFDADLPTPALEDVLEEYQQLQRGLESAKDADFRMDVLKKWDTLCRKLHSWYALVELRFNQDTRDPQYKEDLEFRDKLWPKFLELAISMKRRLLQNPFRKDIEFRFGPHAAALWEAEIMTYDPVIQEDLTAESKLKEEYIELTASAELLFEEEAYNISEIIKFAEDPVRKIRHASQKVLWNWFEENGATLDLQFSKLVLLRTGMAKKLGYKDYIRLAYKQMKRMDYGFSEVVAYRKEILEHVVPLAQKIRENQRLRLGLDTLYAYDEQIFDPAGNPRPKGGHDFLLDKAGAMFDQMGEGMGEFFRVMRDRGLLDLKNREGKAPGGFCTYFPSLGLPFVFANFNGTMEDVFVFAHEAGHAFQSYSSRELPLLDYQMPSYDTCEVHSMSLEFLTLPQMEQFFSREEALRYRKIQIAKALLFLPHGAAIDHFQHLVYENPDATPQERHEMWREMERTYLPTRNWHDLAYPARGGRWQLTPHLYLNPFYYIDYALAECVALQFWHLSERDMREAMKRYAALCRRGGEAPFQQLIREAGLKSLFDRGCLEEVVKYAYDAGCLL